MSVIKALLSSRKFVAALAALAGSIAVVLGFEEEMAARLITGIITVAGLFIVGTAAEDVAGKMTAHQEGEEK